MASCLVRMKQIMLVFLMIGLEAGLMLKVLLMVANLQTLGVSISMTSIPGTVSAAIGIFSIPSLGLFMDRFASSTSAKAKILVFVSALLLLGNACVFLANLDKLLKSSDNRRVSLPPPFDATPSPHEAAYGHQQDPPGYYFAELKSETHSQSSSLSLYAIIAMIGYALVDNGYDSGNCFLKTFALACTHEDDHASIIVKSVLISSFGGGLVSLLCSVGVGELLTRGTLLDPNAAQAMFLSGLCFILTITGLGSTLLTGFCCPPLSFSDWDYNDNSRREDTHLINECNGRSDQSVGRNVPDTLSTSIIEESTSENSFSKSEQCFFNRYRKQIVINITTFFLLGALYSFENYCSNFAGIKIFNGDPAAPVGSPSYNSYLEGIEVGGRGSLIYYVSFTIMAMLLETALKICGKKSIVIGISIVLGGLCLALALFANLWMFRITAFWLGILRSVALAIPYILAAEIAQENPKEGNTGVYISIVSAMLPLSFTICAAAMGPLIDVTENAAVPIYYASACSFLGAFTFAFLDM